MSSAKCCNLIVNSLDYEQLILVCEMVSIF